MLTATISAIENLTNENMLRHRNQPLFDTMKPININISCILNVSQGSPLNLITIRFRDNDHNTKKFPLHL